MTLFLSRKHLSVGLLGLLLAVAPFAAADTISLTTNNLGISASVGTVTLTQVGVDQVQVSVSMNSGYTVKLQGGQFGFNYGSALGSSNFGPVTIVAGGTTYTGLSFQQLRTTQNVSQFGTFAFDLANLTGGPNGITSADQFSFTITAPDLTVSQLLSLNNSGNAFVIHFCAGGGTNCAPSTGFAAGAPGTTTPVPEPGTIGMLGTGLLAAAGLIRRRFM